MNPALSGEPDESTVSLDIVPVGGGLTRIAGFSFYAMRETVALKTVPQNVITIAPVTDSGGKQVTVDHHSPYTNYVNGQQVGPYSGGILRSDYFRFSPSTDSWDLSGLGPGFSPVSFQIGYWTFDGCLVGVLPTDETIYNDGK